MELGTLRSYDGCANNEHIKVCVGLISVSRLFHVGHVVQNRRVQPRSQGLSSSHKREWSTTPSCGKTKDPGNEVGRSALSLA